MSGKFESDICDVNIILILSYLLERRRKHLIVWVRIVVHLRSKPSKCVVTSWNQHTYMISNVTNSLGQEEMTIHCNTYKTSEENILVVCQNENDIWRLTCIAWKINEAQEMNKEKYFQIRHFFNQRSLIKRLTKSAKCKLVLVSCIQQNSHANKRVAWVLQLDLIKFTFLELWSNSAAKMDNKRHWSKRTLYEKKIQWYIFFCAQF